MTSNKNNEYEDIIDLPHHVSKNHPHMSMIDRAAQFSPFAALTGHQQAIKEVARYTEKYMELDENEKELLNEKIKVIKEHLSTHPKIYITYFQPDKSKQGGSYVKLHYNVKKIDEYKKCIIFEDDTEIPFHWIYEIESEIFMNNNKIPQN